ncbi:MAG: M23 family metallopeptidase [Gaiellaceae bacterium]
MLLAGVFAGTAPARPAMPQTITFPVAGPGQFTDDYGDPRWGGWHQGNDIMSRRWQPAVAAVNGRVDLHMSSSGRTCMLYLRHASGATYVYIHLNNDLTMRNDNTGGCREGVSYPVGLKDGDLVRRGQLIAYVGDSGDADGIQPHLHFEIRPNGSPINPYQYLRRARRILFPRGPSLTDAMTVTLSGRFKGLTNGQFAMRVAGISTSLGVKFPITRRVVFTLPADAVVQRSSTTGLAVATTAQTAVAGERVTVQTAAFLPYFSYQLAAPGALAAAHILLRG